ncbi:MAG: hypothetical protein ABJB61_02135 [bacterium]
MGSKRAAQEKTGEVTFKLRERALEALKSSTKMLEIAVNLWEQGNSREADRLRYEARGKRNESMLLIAQANGINTSRHHATMS